MGSRIRAIEAIPLKLPLPRKFSGSHYFMTHRCTIVTRVTTEDGAVGEIYNGDEMDAQHEILKMITDRMGPLVVGKNIFHTNDIWNAMEPFTFDILSDRKIALQAMACIDSAVCDAVGKTLGQPLHRLWGSSLRKLPLMIIGGYYQDGIDYDPMAIRADIEQFQSMGASGIKFKVGGRTPEIDARRVEIAREAAGGGFAVAVDANQAWTRTEALRFANAVKHLDIRWFEEPCRWNTDRAAMRDIRNMSGIPVNAGQSEVSAAACIELMTSGAIDVCNYDASWGGGPTSWRQAAAAGAALGIEMGHHEEPQIAAHLLSAAPTSTFLEVFHPDRDPLFYEIVENRKPFKNGYYELPDGDGFGVMLDRKAIEKYRADR